MKPTSERAPDAPPPEALTTVDPDAGRKHWLTLQARAALAGFELVCMADGSVVAGRWGKLLVLADLATVEAFLVRAGAPA